MPTKTDPIKDLLARAVDEVIVAERLEEQLRSKKKLRVKFGIDPTAPEMHIGHLVPLQKLKAFQELGHTVVFIIGNFTAMIGDPSGKNELRKPLTREETQKNAADYLKEAGKILDIKKAEIHFNSEWLDKFGIEGMYELMSKITIQRALERDDFQKRLEDNQDISIIETIYPLLQGFDSVAIKADVEIGGTDQKFNLLMGRRIQRKYGHHEQNIMTLWLIEGTDGVRKMSKSFGNYISLRDPPNDMYGKVMSIPDKLIIKYFSALTTEPLDSIERLSKLPARDSKMKLAKEIVRICHTIELAEKAESEFVRVFQKRDMPTDIPEKKLSSNKYEIVELLVAIGFAKSKSEAQRLVKGGGVTVDGKKILDPFAKIILGPKQLLLRIGKRHFMRLVAA